MTFKGLDIVLGNLTVPYITAVMTSIGTFVVTLLLCIGSKYGLWRNPAVADQLSSERQCINENEPAERSRELDVTELQESNSAGDQDISSEQQLRRRAKRLTIQDAEKVIQAGMSEEQKNQEQMIQRQQLSEIYKLLQKQPEKFGTTTLDDLEEQMKLYRL